jgi:hypothetical protein
MPLLVFRFSIRVSGYGGKVDEGRKRSYLRGLVSLSVAGSKYSASTVSSTIVGRPRVVTCCARVFNATL